MLAHVVDKCLDAGKDSDEEMAEKDKEKLMAMWSGGGAKSAAKMKNAKFSRAQAIRHKISFINTI